MRLLLIGDWHSKIHEEALSSSLRKHKIDVIKFSWHQYFKTHCNSFLMSRIFSRLQNKFLFGPIITQLNNDVIETAQTSQPDVIFIYRGTHILPQTIQKLHILLPKVFIIGYNNDDPFSPHYPEWFWRHFIESIPLLDLVLAYRVHNIQEFYRAGARHVELMRSWFVPEQNFPLISSQIEEKKFGCDIVFIGHYEPDGRISYLEEIERAGWRLKIFGSSGNWNKAVSKSKLLRHHLPIQPVWGQDYNSALGGAKIALCFFSKLNRDSYTRRCFEIPASGTLMLSEFSEDMSLMFAKNKEVVFFADIPEMMRKIKYFMGNPNEREKIAKRGRKRVWLNGHDIDSRVKQLLAYIDEYNTTSHVSTKLVNKDV